MGRPFESDSDSDSSESDIKDEASSEELSVDSGTEEQMDINDEMLHNSKETPHCITPANSSRKRSHNDCDSESDDSIHGVPRYAQNF